MIRIALALVAALALSACSSSGFKIANDENSTRIRDHQDAMLEQAEKDMAAVNACYLRSSGYVQLVPGGPLTKIAEPSSSAEGCTVMAALLRNTATLMTAFQPFLVQPVLARVPAAPEEIVQSILKDGMKFALTKYGLEAVERVVSSGQLAQAQTSAAALQAVADRPAPVILTVPEGGTATVLTPTVSSP